MGIKQLGPRKFQLDFRTSSGRRKRRTIEGPRHVAEAIMNDIKVKKYKREFLGIIELEKISLEDFLSKYIEYAYANKSWKEAITEERAFKANIIPYFGKETHLAEITPHMIARFKAKRINEVSPATVNRNLQYLKHSFKMAIERGYLKDNSASRIKKLRESPGRVRWLKPVELDEFLKYSNARMGSIFLFAINTGLRTSEINKLRWDDVLIDSIDSNIILDGNVDKRYLDYSNGGIFVRESKNDTSRIVPMNDVVLNIIRQLPRENEHVFGGRGFRDSFEYARKKANIPDFKFHDTRHTFASYLVMNGNDIRTVQYLMGHKDIKMTMRYSHLSRGHLQGAVDSISHVFKMDTFRTQTKKEGVKDNA